MSTEYPVSLVSIYALIDPRDGRIRYVGKSVNPKKRLRAHLRDCPLARTHRECWLKGLVDAGLRPQLIILEECEEALWIEREQFWIAHQLAQGCDLTNRTIGGDGLRDPSDETRAKISSGVSKALKGRPFTEAHKAAMKAAHPKLGPNAKCRAAVSVANASRVWSESARAKLGAAHRGRKVSDETKAKIFEKRAQPFVLTNPQGERVEIVGFARFCRENGMDRTAFLGADRRGRPYKGWTIIREPKE